MGVSEGGDREKKPEQTAKKKMKPMKASHQIQSPKSRQCDTRFERVLSLASHVRYLCDILLSLLLFDLEQ